MAKGEARWQRNSLRQGQVARRGKSKENRGSVGVRECTRVFGRREYREVGAVMLDEEGESDKQ